jgi:hypothetical protein
MPEQTSTTGPGLKELVPTIFCAANTSDVIHWNELRNRLHASPPGLTERERADLLIAFANGNKLPARQWNQLVGLRVIKGKDEYPAALPDAMRSMLVSSLDVITAGSDAQRKELLYALNDVVDGGVLLAPSRSNDKKTRVITRAMSGGVAYALWVLLEGKDELGKELCRCNYSQCRHFFFKRREKNRRGAPSYMYCTPRCGKDGDREKARERMRERRP